jgi:hypothetical protein
VGSRETLLKNRTPALADLYLKLETTVRGFGAVEVVTRDRCPVPQTRICGLDGDAGGVAVVIHPSRKASAPHFIKVGHGDKRIRMWQWSGSGAGSARSFPFLRRHDLTASGEEP